MIWIEQLKFVFGQWRWQDALDILLVWIIVYQTFVLIRRSGTIQILSGLGFLALIYLASIWLELFTFNWLLDKFFSNLFLIVVVLFQAEIRRALAIFGSNPFFSESALTADSEALSEVITAVDEMLKQKMGALIVIEREIFLDSYLETGTLIRAEVSAELLMSIFHAATPLHDGAVLLRSGKIHSAGNFLPLSKNPFLDKNLGTRHRAAVGLSEETDALVMVISEESQSLSVAIAGSIKPITDIKALKRFLHEELSSQLFELERKKDIR